MTTLSEWLKIGKIGHFGITQMAQMIAGM